MPDARPGVHIPYEVGSPLERIWADHPRLARLLVDRPNYAKAVQLYLRGIDLYLDRTGLRADQVIVETRQDRDKIVQRIRRR